MAPVVRRPPINVVSNVILSCNEDKWIISQRVFLVCISSFYLSLFRRRFGRRKDSSPSRTIPSPSFLLLWHWNFKIFIHIWELWHRVPKRCRNQRHDLVCLQCEGHLFHCRLHLRNNQKSRNRSSSHHSEIGIESRDEKFCKYLSSLQKYVV